MRGSSPRPLRIGTLSQRLRPLGQTDLAPLGPNALVVFHAPARGDAVDVKAVATNEGQRSALRLGRGASLGAPFYIIAPWAWPTALPLRGRMSPHWGLSPGPSVYKADALPRSYRGSCSTPWARSLLAPALARSSAGEFRIEGQGANSGKDCGR